MRCARSSSVGAARGADESADRSRACGSVHLHVRRVRMAAQRGTVCVRPRHVCGRHLHSLTPRYNDFVIQVRR